MIMTLQKIFLFFVSLFLSFFVVLILGEASLRILKPAIITGAGQLEYAQDEMLGWIPKEGKVSFKTGEFQVTYEINDWGMNDRPAVEELIKRSQFRILALGDSHTFAWGVSQWEAWPNVLENMLFGNDLTKGTVFNTAVPGYNVGQYLVKMRSLLEPVKPQLILIGFSMATDLYDIIPPSRGGFVYGINYGRTYFDLDSKGNLIEINDLAGKVIEKNVYENQRSISLRFRDFLGKSVLYSRFRKSKLALWMSMYFHPGGQSLWPGQDTVFKINLNSDDQYRWSLVEAIIKKISDEARANQARVVLVHIPYIAEIYDDVWNWSFGLQPDKYDRLIGAKRLKEICERSGVYYVNTTPNFIRASKEKKKWLHYSQDAHPNVDGHKVIAETVFNFLKKNNLVVST